MQLTTKLTTALSTILATVALAQDTSPVLPITNADAVATDDLGRTLPTHVEVGDPKPDRWVGVFYWQWHGGERWWKHYNMTEFLKDKPYFRDFEVRPKDGPAHPTWYWAEPLFGYYRSTDPWVIRKHIVMLADAGVDFLFMDYTNSSVYDKELETFLTITRELKDAGVAVPKITFFLNHQPEWKTHHLYTTWYAKPEWRDMWFVYRGKPLILTSPIADVSKLREGQDAAVVPAINDYFTFRKTWALFSKQKEPTRWRFIGEHNTPAAVDENGNVEQIVVCKSMGGPLNNGMALGGVSGVPGKSFTKEDYDPQWMMPDAAEGKFFDAQWANAEKKNAPITLVTGWNEWKASVWDQKGVPMFGVPITPPYGYLVDEFNEQFNRDLEPMRGGQFDAYHMQFVARMRQYKGMAAPQKTSAPATIKLDGDPADWSTVTPVYFDAPNDTADRDHDATVPHLDALQAVKNDAERKKLPMIRYVSKTARNDLGNSHVARDDANVYFHVTTAKPLSPATDAQWMWLLIDTDANPKTGWHGYDLRVNRSRAAAGKTSVERHAAKGWTRRVADDAAFAAGERDLEIALPRTLFGDGPLKFDFKWADNLPAEPTIEDFYTDGDVAPNTRLNFRFDETVRP